MRDLLYQTRRLFEALRVTVYYIRIKGTVLGEKVCSVNGFTPHHLVLPKQRHTARAPVICPHKGLGIVQNAALCPSLARLSGVSWGSRVRERRCEGEQPCVQSRFIVLPLIVLMLYAAWSGGGGAGSTQPAP